MWEIEVQVHHVLPQHWMVVSGQLHAEVVPRTGHDPAGIRIPAVEPAARCNKINPFSPSPKCIGYSDESQNSLQATNFSYTKQYSNQSALTEYNSGVRLPLPT
jgi:hypothetical protein